MVSSDGKTGIKGGKAVHKAKHAKKLLAGYGDSSCPLYFLWVSVSRRAGSHSLTGGLS